MSGRGIGPHRGVLLPRGADRPARCRFFLGESTAETPEHRVPFVRPCRSRRTGGRCRTRSPAENERERWPRTRRPMDLDPILVGVGVGSIDQLLSSIVETQPNTLRGSFVFRETHASVGVDTPSTGIFGQTTVAGIIFEDRRLAQSGNTAQNKSD